LDPEVTNGGLENIASAKGRKSESCGALVHRRLKPQRRAVEAMALAGGLRTIVENVP
jgi:hypothetical protein